MITTLEVKVPCQDDPDGWFSESPSMIALSKALCQECPIKDKCLTRALENQENFGIWGGEDFNRRSYAKSTKLCRKGLHPKDGPGKCKDCVKASPSYKKNNSHNKYRKSRVSNFLGKECINHHLLTPESTTLTKQKKLLCKACIKGRFQKRMS